MPLIAITHCEAAKVVSKFGASTNGFLCPTQWAETLSYRDDTFGSAADYDKLFKATYELAIAQNPTHTTIGGTRRMYTYYSE